MAYEAVEFVAQLRRSPGGKMLRASQKAVMFVLANRLNKKLGYAYPSMQSIAAESGITKRRAQQVLKNLEMAGVISTTRRKADDGKNKTNCYCFPNFSDWLSTQAMKNRAREGEAGCMGMTQAASPEPEVEPEQTTAPRGEDSTFVSDSLQAFDLLRREIFNYFVERSARNPKVYSMGPKRRRAISEITRTMMSRAPETERPESYAKRAWFFVIDKLVASDWHMGRDPKSNCRGDLMLIARDIETFETWLH
jgi:hypothetical protein